jgi:hypothetical protein
MVAGRTLQTNVSSRFSADSGRNIGRFWQSFFQWQYEINRFGFTILTSSIKVLQAVAFNYPVAS